MTPGELQRHCLAKPGAWPDNPWDHEHPVIKVGEAPAAGKIFAFLGDGSVGVKAGADREQADEWLARYPDDAAVMAYIGRSGWNTLTVGGAIPDDEILAAVDDSYALVVVQAGPQAPSPGAGRTRESAAQRLAPALLQPPALLEHDLLLVRDHPDEAQPGPQRRRTPATRSPARSPRPGSSRWPARSPSRPATARASRSGRAAGPPPSAARPAAAGPPGAAAPSAARGRGSAAAAGRASSPPRPHRPARRTPAG